MSNAKFRLVVVALLLISALPACGSNARGPTTFYVSPDGDNRGAGTVERPWQTVQFALGKLVPGDVLYLRNGTYYEHELEINLRGSASAPITIQSFPGERAIIDGGLPAFREAPNNDWELVDGRSGVYRSRATIKGSFVRARLIDDNSQLIEYKSKESLETNNFGPVKGNTAIFAGPGIQLRSDGHIYVRLQSNPNDLINSAGQALKPTPVNFDPNLNRIAVFLSKNIFLLSNAAYLRFKDLSFAHSEALFDVNPGSHHIEIVGSRFDFGTYGLVIRPGAHDWQIHDSEFDGGLPDNVYWTDVKNNGKEATEAYPEFQSAALVGPFSAFDITRNVFQHTFDGIDFEVGATTTHVAENIFRYVRDDGIELPKGIRDIEIAHNMLWWVGSGVSIVGSGGTAGPVYIHHNVIDNSKYQHGGRSGTYNAEDWPAWTTIDPFSSHDSNYGADAWWRVYNNTIVTRKSGYLWDAAGPSEVTGSREKYVYNNIFYVLDDRLIFRDDLVRKGSHYDGNIFFRRTPGGYPLFLNFGNGRDYQSLADFRALSGTDWEKNGLEIDPGFDLAAITDSRFDAATIWSRYRPSNPKVFTTGAPYQGLGWPDTEEVTYRGAVPP